MRTSILYCVLFLLSLKGLAQTDSFTIPPWYLVMVDNKDQLYVTLRNGDLMRQSLNDPDETLLYSPVKKSRISLLDVNNPLRPFLFYEDLQEYVLLDRFLTETVRYSLATYTSFCGIAAPALNNQLWLVDMADFSIKKVDPQFEQVQIRIPLPQVLKPEQSNFTYLREYQNLLFLVDESSGIYVFDNLGNFLHQTEAIGVLSLNFFKDGYYFQERNNTTTVTRVQIYSGEQSAMALPTPGRAVILTSEYIWVFTDKSRIRHQR